MIALKRIFGSFVDEEAGKSARHIHTAGRFYKVKKTSSNYEVTVDITGDAPYSTCVISINAVTGGERKIAIAARYSWKRYWRGGKEQDIQTTSNTLHVSPLDAGCYIKVYITPMEEDTIYNEITTVIFGPIVLDPLTKKTVQGIMRAGGFKFQVDRFMVAESEDHGADGMIMLTQSSLHLVSRKNPNMPIKILLSQPIKISSQRNQFKTFTLEFSDEDVSRDMCKLFGIPFSRNLRRIKFVMSSMNSKDLLLLSIHLFRSMQSIKDGDLFQMVSDFVKDAPQISVQHSSADQEIDSEEETPMVMSPGSPSKMRPDVIDRLFLNNGMKEEIYKLYNSNQQLAVQRNELQMKVVNLESELTKSISKSSGVPEPEAIRSPEHDASAMIDSHKIGMTRQKNAEISDNIRIIENQNAELKSEVDRLTKVFKQMRYKEMLDSKLNATVRRAPEKDISGLEKALQDYAEEYKKLMDNLGVGKQTKDRILPDSDSERSLSLVDEMEDRTQEILMKNERLKEDIQKHRDMIAQIENRSAGKKNGASIIGNESFMRITPARNNNKVEYEVKIESLDNRIERLTFENKDLNEQISSLKSKLAEQDENDQQARIYNKLKHQKNELVSILSEKRQLLNDLQRTKIMLSDKEIDMRTSVVLAEDESSKIAEMKGKREQLEKSHRLLSKEIYEQNTLAAKLEQEHREMIKEYSTIGSPMPGPSPTSAVIDRLKANAKSMEDKIIKLESMPAPVSLSAGQPSPDSLTAAERGQFDTEKKMNERLMNEIIRLNEVIMKCSASRNESTIL